MTGTIAVAACPTENAIVRTLMYFEIFMHPLTADEVFQFSNCPKATRDEVFEKLENLVKQGCIFQFGSFYQTRNDPMWVPRRIESNLRADKLLPTARRMARLIGAFPFIRGVFVSGSLSKHCMRADSDIDFFIITEPGRLWLARTLLVFFKKIFLLNSHKYFCINYFVDTTHLEIEEKNLFTATETATLLPMYGREWYESFYQANGWIRDFLPFSQSRLSEHIPPHRKSFFKKTAETLLNGRLGAWLDGQAMRITVTYWRRKFGHFDQRTFDGAFKSRTYVSKHHPLYFQQRVLKQYGERMTTTTGSAGE
ncbi:MAG: hypothetical protein OHK0019_35790 [Saprospiraceae bacterium]